MLPGFSRRLPRYHSVNVSPFPRRLQFVFLYFSQFFLDIRFFFVPYVCGFLLDFLCAALRLSYSFGANCARNSYEASAENQFVIKTENDDDGHGSWERC